MRSSVPTRLTIAIACLIWSFPAAAYKALVPRPQSIQFGSGKLALQDISISFGTTPSAEDRFAAGQLASAVSSFLGAPIQVGSAASAKAPKIALYRSGTVDALPGPNDQPGPNSREAYEIEITARGAQARARTSAGLYYAVQTIRQLLDESGGQKFLPEVTIHDWPAMAYRGFMMDLSHGALPTEDEIKRQIDFLARWKANQYYFYSEANIELRGYPTVEIGSRYTREQILQIIDYARERHVDVVPCVEFFGHLHDLFRVERYASLAAVPHGGDINPRNPQAQALLKDWAEQLAALFPSPWFHAGLDEPWELQKSSQAEGVADPGKLYIEQLKSVTGMLEALGKRPMFWADVDSGARIFTTYPNLVSQLPKQAVAVTWQYRAMPDYSAAVAPLAREKVPQFIASGIWCWDEIAPDFHRTFENIDGLLAAGRKYGALGLINTGWSDASQVLYRMALPGMAYGAAAAWQRAPMDRAQFFVDYSDQFYLPPMAAEVAPALEAMAQSQQLLSKVLGGETALRIWDDPLTPERLKRAEANRQQLHEIRLQAEEAEAHLVRALRIDGNATALPSLLVGARMLDYAGMKYLYAAEIAGYFQTLGKNPAKADVQFYLGWETSARNHGRAGDLMDEISDLREAYRRAWLEEYTEHRLQSVLTRWDAEADYWRRFQTHLWDVIHNFHDHDVLPGLEELRPRN